MNPRFSFLSLCLLCAVSDVWGQDFNPQPRSETPGANSAVMLPNDLTPAAIQEAFSAASNGIAERNLVVNKIPTRPVSIPVARHQRSQMATPKSRRLESTQEVFEEATMNLKERFNLSPQQIAFALSEVDLKGYWPDKRIECESQLNITCKAKYKYRTLDGTCNNRRHPSWGMASSCFARLVPPDYGDGTSEKRLALSGNPLPSPRRISLELHSQRDNPSDYITHMFMVFGQFLSHDISLAPHSQTFNQKFLMCCPVSLANSQSCDPILMEPDDPFYSTFNVTCLSNIRSAKCPSCKLGPRQQINQVTAYIDASHIYGNDLSRSNFLRNNDGTGTMKFVNNPVAGELPPGSAFPEEDACSFQDTNFDCFETGDERANQHPAITCLHVVFLREHNRIARRLKEINRHWDDETLYQEARKIVGAEMQIITYNEYLPLVIGPERMEYFDLPLLGRDQYTKYGKNVRPTVVNEFSAAAFRFGHSMINSFFPDSRGSNRGNYLKDTFFYPFEIYRGKMEGIMEGLADFPAQEFDRHLVHDVTNHLFQFRSKEIGLDLASLDIMRGRDHGIPGYTALVEFCGGPRIRQWRDLDFTFRKGLRTRFESLYEQVEDIDLYSGSLAERPNPGAVVGPTFICIIGIQFYHLKYGDRFYFEHGKQPGSFTLAQLRELKKMTLGKIICNNAKIKEMNTYAFLYANRRNPLEPCSSKPDMDFEAWRDSY